MLFFLICLSFSLSLITVEKGTGRFRDESGRYRFFHGMNMVYKISPYMPDTIDWDPLTSFTYEDAKFLKESGFNILRLGVMMPGVMPDFGIVDYEYLQNMESIVNLAGRAGIVSLIDLHQDLLTSRFCGEGLTDYMVPTTFKDWEDFARPIWREEFPRDEKGNVSYEQCMKHEFFTYYETYDVGVLFKCLYENCNPFEISEEKGPNVHLLDEVRRYWGVVSEYFANNEYVFGYELTNELYPPNIYEHPNYLINSKDAEAEVIEPYYRALMETVYMNDQKHLLAFEPIVTNLAETGYSIGGPGASIGIPPEKQVYSYHFYCGLQNSTADPISRAGCDLWDTFYFRRYQDNIKYIGSGGILSEFGAVMEHDAAMTELGKITSLCDTEGVSWIYWQYKPFNDITTQCEYSEGVFNPDGTEQEIKLSQLSYPYPQFLAGDVVGWEYNKETRVFHMSYTAPSNFNDYKDLTTIIFIGAKHQAQNGYTLSVTPSDSVTYTEDGTFLNIIPLFEGIEIIVDIEFY